MSPTLSLITIVLLLAANGFFVAAEFALVKAKGFRLDASAAQGSRSARLAVRIQGNLESYLAACQLGITMASLGLGWVGEPAVAHLLEPVFTRLGFSETAVHSTSFIIGFLIFSSLHIVVGEQVPKTLAIRKPEPVSIWVAYPLQVAYLAVYPLNWLLNEATSLLLSKFGVENATHADVFSGAELQGLVATSSEHGEFDQEHADMLNNLFEFDQRQVSRVMVPRNAVHCLDVSLPPEKNLEVIRETEHSRFPVVDDAREDKIVGVLLISDVYKAMLAGEAEPWKDLHRFCREPMIVPESQRVPQLFEAMRLKRVHIAIVVDEYGEFVGVVTLEDLLEEIVGEIQDETDDDESERSVKSIGDELWEADGLTSLSDLEKQIGLTVPDDLDANTLSGLFMERLARMPEVDDQIVEAGFRMSAVTIVERRLGRTTIEKLPESVDSTDTEQVDTAH